ncbi:MAG: DNA topoisomerase (ATP-hydrolyzing) subunit B [Actinobacteria bacterium]|nr:DNA topoisomerase (ATP-hydrolyzing) subunit B [Actinomycetota bacterium]
MAESYTAKDIRVLEGLEAVRKRPGMYIGDTGSRGLHHLVYEILDNSVDEALVGACDRIEIIIHDDNSVTVIDNGRGIPVDIMEGYEQSALTIVLTRLHAGGKFGGSGYKVSGGLHGVGVSVVNALSERLIAEVRRDGKIYRQEFSRGKALTDVIVVGESEKTGTTIHFKPDKEIFEDIRFNSETIKQRIKEIAYLVKGLTIVFRDERPESKEEITFRFDGGLVDFVRDLNKNRTPIHPNIFYFNASSDDEMVVEVALQYNEGTSDSVFTFANNINTTEGGTHLSGFRSALTRAINEYARKKGFLKEKDENFQGEDVRYGLLAIVSVKLKNPQFEGQTKTRLGNTEVKSFVEGHTYQRLLEFLEENPRDAKEILSRVTLAARERIEAKKARELVRRKSFLETSTLPGKLADCVTRNPEEAELFLVEGDSAGGSAKQARNRHFQAILPLKGKIINVQKASKNKVFHNEEIGAIITAIGTGVGDDFDINNLRYGKIIIMSDADVDGAHIRTLALTFFYNYARELIERGHVYIAQPPLYKIQVSSKEIYYAYSDEELKTIIEQKIGNDRKYVIQRYKGLGEMNPQQLWETTMNPETRTLVKVTIEDAVKADEIFNILMGDKVEPRKEFIQKYARQVRFLDI